MERESSLIHLWNIKENKKLMDAIEGAYKVVRLVATRGKEVAARSIFDGWDGVNWEDGNRDQGPLGSVSEVKEPVNVDTR